MPKGFSELTVGGEFPSIKVSKADALKGMFKDQAEKDEEVKPVFCIFVPGGIGTNELRELRDIETDKELGGIVTIGSGTDYLTPLNYLKELKIINQQDSDPEDEEEIFELAKVDIAVDGEAKAGGDEEAGLMEKEK
jgi:hypothetical protein